MHLEYFITLRVLMDLLLMYESNVFLSFLDKSQNPMK